MNNNRLKINCTKTVCMLIGTKHMLRKHSSLNLRIKNNVIGQVQSFKYLGVFIDSEMKWSLHIEELCKKIGKMISFLGRLSSFVNESGLKLLYNSVIMPHIDYADVIWSSAAKTHLEMLQKLQNRAGRIILKVKPSEHKSIHEIHYVLNWETLQKRQTRHMYSLMYKIFHNLTPTYLEEKFKFKSTGYALRTDNNLTLPKPNTQSCKRTFSYRGSVLYNELPLHIRESSSTTIFNREVQLFL